MRDRFLLDSLTLGNPASSSRVLRFQFSYCEPFARVVERAANVDLHVNRFAGSWQHKDSPRLCRFHERTSLANPFPQTDGYFLLGLHHGVHFELTDPCVVALENCDHDAASKIDFNRWARRIRSFSFGA